jgi:hypothetical protein
VLYVWSVQKNHLMGILKRLRTIYPALKMNDTLNKLTSCDVLLVCHDVNRGDLKSNLPYSKFIDSIYEDLVNRGYICKQFALPFSLLVGEKAWAKPYSGNRIYFFACAFNAILRRIKKITRIGSSTDRPEDRYVYGLVLKKARPKFIIAIGSPRALCRRASEINIPVLELLHSIGYDRVRWGWDQEKPENIPSHILSVDRISTRAFSPLIEKGVQVIEIPHPWYNRFISWKDMANIDSEWIKMPFFIPKNKKVILVSLTTCYDGDHGNYPYYANILENGLIPKELVAAIEKTHESIIWCLRRHPVQLRNAMYNNQLIFLDELVNRNPNCEWQKTSIVTLNSLLSIVDGHMSMSSGTSYDAAMMGVKSLLFCPTLEAGMVNANWFSDLIDEGYAIKITPDVSFIIDWAKNIQRVSPFSISNSKDEDWDILLRHLTIEKQLVPHKNN